MNKLEEARLIINEVDSQIAALYEKRMDAVKSVVEYKLEQGLPVLDSSRESQVIERNSKLIKNPEYLPFYKKLLQDIMDNSKEFQNTFLIHDKVGYQGTEGAFSHIALRNCFKNAVEVKYPTFEELIHAVERKEVRYGVIPFENSYAGDVAEILDLFYTHKDIRVNAIYDLKVNQNLIVKPGTTFEDIKKVYSKDQALNQCADFLNGRGYELIPYANTALAAKLVAESDDKSIACIASAEVAEIYHLEVLAKDIMTAKDNMTRFAIVGLEDNKEETDRFSLFFTIKHEPGSLARIIDIISSCGLNMESIKSKPMKSVPWQYYFYVELIGNLNEEKTKLCLNLIETQCISCRVLGSYKKIGDKYEPKNV